MGFVTLAFTFSSHSHISLDDTNKEPKTNKTFDYQHDENSGVGLGFPGNRTVWWKKEKGKGNESKETYSFWKDDDPSMTSSGFLALALARAPATPLDIKSCCWYVVVTEGKNC